MIPPESSPDSELTAEQYTAGQDFRKTMNRIFYIASERIIRGINTMIVILPGEESSYFFVKDTSGRKEFPALAAVRVVQHSTTEGELVMHEYYLDGSVRQHTIDLEKTGMAETLDPDISSAEAIAIGANTGLNLKLEAMMGVHEASVMAAENIRAITSEMRQVAGIDVD